MPDVDDAAPEPGGGLGAEPLSMWQRSIAGLLGLGTAGAGGASVFVTSNQAGSVALVGVGAGFLIMAVNGMPIIGLKLQDFELKMAQRRRKVLERAASELPDEASHTLEVLQEIDPGARADPAVLRARAGVYHAEVFAALWRAASDSPESTVRYLRSDGGADIEVQRGSKVIDAVVRFTGAPDSVLPTHFVQKTYSDADRRLVPLLVIVNWRLNNQISEIAKPVDPEGKKIQFVRWQDQQDDLALRLALTRLLGVPDTPSA